MSESDERIAFLRQLFERYTSLPRHSAGEEFQECLHTLKAWECEDIRRRHALACDGHQHYAAVLDYYLIALHNGLKLQGMIDQGPQGLENTRRLNKAYQLFADAMEYSVLTAVAQDNLVTMLGDKPLTQDSHAQAIAECGDKDTRLRRLDLLVAIGHGVAPYIGSRVIHTGFRLLKGVFRSSGMAEIHETLDEGFRQLRAVPRLAQILAEFAETEKRQLAKIPVGQVK